jgi:putative flippase GtrA
VEKFNKQNFLEIYRFLIVGICSVSIDFIFYYFFIYFDFFDPNNSKRISFIIGAIFAFYANRNYVFRVNQKKFSQYIMFSILYFTSFILNSIVHDYIYLISNLTLVSFLCATMVSTITNFTGQKFLIFKNKE